VEIDFTGGIVRAGSNEFQFEPLPSGLLEILEAGGLVNWISNR